MSGPDEVPAPVKALRSPALPKAIVVICLAIMVLLAGLFAATRYGVLLPQARVLIEARTDGLKIGRFGQLRIEGLGGDIWRDFSIRRLTVRDEQGVWLEAENLRMTWRAADLLRRRFHADRIEAEAIRVLRRPTLRPKGQDRGLPVSFIIDEARARLELAPEFSYRRGVYDLDLKLNVERQGGQSGALRATSVLHPGDYLNLDFDLSKLRPIVFRADAEEARGGALAGSLGLPADQPFDLKVAAEGRMSEGRFTALATSGEARPLQAAGAWAPDGGQATGRALLTVSSLTRPFAERIGPSVDFVLVGRKAGEGLFALDGRVRAANLTGRVWGMGDIGERSLGPRGLNLTVVSPALSRITGGPQMGEARLSGVLNEADGGWRFAGSGVVTALGIGGYRLQQVSGPLELGSRAGAVSVKASLSGRGGRGSGWAGALLGAAPRATFEASRLADGRLALDGLEVSGAGLKVQASGGRGLTGALTFKGEAALSNLAAARAGAAGSASATWSASQAAAGRPWMLSARAEGRRFATGFAELDRLLGARPRFEARANVQGRRVAVANATLNGAAMRAASAGVLAANGGLTFKLDWNAQGPFRAGPVEISGEAKGTGAITGSLGAPKVDLLAQLDAIDVPRLPLTDAHLTLSFLRRPDGSSGSVALTAASAYGPARASSAFRFPEGGVDLSDLSVDAGGVRVAGGLALRRNAPSAADLDVTVTAGAFLESGQVSGQVRVVDAPGGPTADLALAAENARLAGSAIALRSGRISAAGPLSRLPYVAELQGASARGGWSLEGRGVVAQTDPGYAATFDGAGRLGSRNLRTIEAAVLRFGGPERTARLRLVASDGGRVDLDGRLVEDGADVRLRLAGLGLGLLDPDLAGQVDATLTLQGRDGRLDGNLDARLADARGAGSDPASGIDGTVQGRLADSRLTLQGGATNEQGLRANVNLVLPTEASAAPFRLAIARQRPIQGRFFAEGEIRPLWDLLVGGERSLSGRVRTEGTLGGSLADPTALGQISVDAGRFDDGATGLSLREVTLRADFTDDAVDVTQVAGVDGQGGSIGGAGRISLLRDGASTFRMDLRGFRLIDNDQATASATGEATIARAANGKVTLSGALTIDQAEIAADLPTPSGVVVMDVVERNRPVDLAASVAPVAQRGAGWALDVTLKAPRRVFLRGRGLDLELSLDAHVGGTTSRPDLSGTARIVRGDYDFAGKRFEFDDQGVVYLSTRPESIRLDLSATREDPSLTAVVRIRGTAARPEITLTSTPVLPNDEVLSQVLFGRSAAQLSPLEAAQLASAISALASGGGFDVIGNLRNFAGLDRLAFAGGDESGMTVAGGKYLTDDVYLEIIGGGREGTVAQVEWRVRGNLAIISRLAGQGGGRLAVRWRRDY